MPRFTTYREYSRFVNALADSFFAASPVGPPADVAFQVPQWAPLRRSGLCTHPFNPYVVLVTPRLLASGVPGALFPLYPVRCSLSLLGNGPPLGALLPRGSRILWIVGPRR